MSDGETRILLFTKVRGGVERIAQDFELADFGSVVPQAGDLIVDPGVSKELDRTDGMNRIIYKVVQRYFVTNQYRDQTTFINLLVEERSGENWESYILGV